MNSKEYKLPNGKKAVFEYDITGVGEITLECMDELMGMIADRPQGEWLIEKTMYDNYNYRCSYCDWYETHAYPDVEPYNFCPNCGARMKGADDESDS